MTRLVVTSTRRSSSTSKSSWYHKIGGGAYWTHCPFFCKTLAMRQDTEGWTHAEADAAMRAGDLARARAALETHLAENATDFKGHVKLAAIRRRLGDNWAALAAIDSAIDLRPFDVVALLLKAALHEKLGEAFQAAEIYHAARFHASNQTISSSANFTGSVAVATSATVGTTLGVTGATTLSSTLAVTGSTDFTASIRHELEKTEFPVLKTEIGNRVAYMRSLLRANTVLGDDNRKAREEIESLGKELISLLQSNYGN